ncbi:MAG: hypothetical protein KatS3mg002_0578 [Candidatus Woesearchaeota archaeon]|nr:MAG: hypothetical protein KatS3mg002_0578 [Candidatus Woesearchaeota archaeon]
MEFSEKETGKIESNEKFKDVFDSKNSMNEKNNIETEKTNITIYNKITGPKTKEDNKESTSEDKKTEEKNNNKEENKEDKKILNRLNSLRKGITSAYKTSMDRGPGFFILILSFIAYIFDFLTDFSRPPNYIVVVIYTLIITYALIKTKTESSKWVDNDFLGLISVIVFTLLFPWTIHYFRENIPYQWIVDLLGLFLLFPPVIIYLMSKYPEDSVGKKIYRLIMLIIIMYLLLQLLNSPTIQGTYESGKPTIVNSKDLLMSFFGNTLKTIDKTIKNTQRSFDIAVKKATGQKYDANEEEQKGIMIENVRPVEKNYFTSSEVYVQAKIRAKDLSIDVPVKTKCYIKDKVEGRTYPEVIMMTGNDENIIDCHLGKLPKGIHQIIVSATFTYRTDADIQYYFVDEKTRPELYSSIKIPDKTVATYTGGPVELGLPSLNQPLRISVDNSKYVGDYPFGVSLNNKWSQGKINKGFSYELEVPEGIKLDKCIRQITSEEKTRDGRTKYVFNINNQNIKETFDSVTCRMNVVNPATLLNGELVAIKTFTARATYEYTIEGTTTVTIVEDYYGG